jgi:transposase
MAEKKYVVRLPEGARAWLHTFVGRGSAPARALTHARILPKANQGEAGPGWTDAAIATALEVGRATVARVRQRYVTASLAAALTHKAPDREYERKLDGAQEARLLALACSTPPAGRQRWTLRLLAERLVALEVVDTVSHETVRQTLQQTRSSRT